MATHPRYRDRHGRLWEDRDGPVLLTHDRDKVLRFDPGSPPLPAGEPVTCPKCARNLKEN